MWVSLHAGTAELVFVRSFDLDQFHVLHGRKWSLCFVPLRPLQADGSLRVQLFPLLLKKTAGVFVQSLSSKICTRQLGNKPMDALSLSQNGCAPEVATFNVGRGAKSTRLELFLRVSDPRRSTERNQMMSETKVTAR